MPRQFYSDKYIKQQRSAKKAEDNLLRTKALAEQTASEGREQRRRFNQEVMESQAPAEQIPE